MLPPPLLEDTSPLQGRCQNARVLQNTNVVASILFFIRYAVVLLQCDAPHVQNFGIVHNVSASESHGQNVAWSTDCYRSIVGTPLEQWRLKSCACVLRHCCHHIVTFFISPSTSIPSTPKPLTSLSSLPTSSWVLTLDSVVAGNSLVTLLDIGGVGASTNLFFLTAI